MSKPFILLLFLGSTKASDFSRVTTMTSVSDTSIGNWNGGTLGGVDPTNCGTDGRGTLIQTRIDDCTALPCDLKANTVVELDIRTSVAIMKPKLILTFTFTGGRPQTETLLVDGSIPRNQQRILKIRGFSGEFLTRELTLKAELLTDDGVPDICVSSQFNTKSRSDGQRVTVILRSVPAFGALFLVAIHLNRAFFNF